jgi:hypothetical protein
MMFDRKQEKLRDGDVHLDGVRGRKRPLIAEIEGVAVDMALAVFSLEGETDSRGLGNVLKNLVQSFQNLRELRRAREREVEVFGKAVVAEMTTLECGATLEDKDLAEPALAQPNQKPGEAVIALEHGLGNAVPPVFPV